MRLRISFWPTGWAPKIRMQSTGNSGAVTGQLFSWRTLGAALLGVLLAKWVWVLFSPASPSMPATIAWKKSDEAERLFGAVSAAGAKAASLLGNFQLIGVFAHKTAGFAVLLTEGKQVGVGLGGLVAPGVRLVETYADHVVLERAGEHLRVELTTTGSAAVAAPSTLPAPAAVAAPSAATSSGGSTAAGAALNLNAPATQPLDAAAVLATLPPEQREAWQHRLENINNLPPEQREGLLHKFSSMRSSP